jgi:hypothetical protein
MMDLIYMLAVAAAGVLVVVYAFGWRGGRGA